MAENNSIFLVEAAIAKPHAFQSACVIATSPQDALERLMYQLNISKVGIPGEQFRVTPLEVSEAGVFNVQISGGVTL